MRIVVFSDSHNEFFAIKRILDLNQGRADLFLHLGDGNREFEDIRDLYPRCAFLGVAGNCDRLCREKGEREFTEGGVRVLNDPRPRLWGERRPLRPYAGGEKTGDRPGAVRPYPPCQDHPQDGVVLFNPGTLRPSCDQTATYGIVDLVDGAINCKIVEA